MLPYRHVLTVVLFSSLLVFTGIENSARELPTSKPQRVGVSQQRLDRITAHMNQAVEDGVMIGGMGMVARNGKIIYSEVYGQADREAGTKMTSDALYRIYSMSKPVVSVALMMLYEEGRLFLNDPVAKYIPELANLEVAIATADGKTKMVSDGTNSKSTSSVDEEKIGQTRKAKSQPTVRDLMRHTAGLTYGIFGNTEVDKQYRGANILRNADLEEFVTELGKIPLQFDPGTRWHYSVSVDVMGRVVEVISGLSLGEFLEQRIFGPLQMRDTAFTVPAAKMDRLVQIYSPEGMGEGAMAFLQPTTSNKLVPSPAELNDNFMEGATFQSGGAGLISTARDYMRFSQMMLNNGELDGVRILSRKSVELMTSNHMAGVEHPFAGGRIGFGLGFAVAVDQGAVGELGSVGEFNWGGAAGTTFWIDPKEQLVGLFMVQSIPHRTRLGKTFKLLTYQSIVD
jgi:CubicO group peptidase (beta-lactamase class C family)